MGLTSLKCLFGSLLLQRLAAAAAIDQRTGPGSQCKFIPGDSGWPSSSAWAQLNQTVGGRLIATVPVASVCHHAPFNSYDQPQCDAIRAAWDFPQTHIFYPGEFNAPYFQNQSCDPFTPSTQPCELGNYVSYSIKVTEVDDVRAGINFARQKNIRLVIRNTGHDYLGKSTGRGGLALWTQHLKSINVLTNYQSPGYSGPAIKLGAGVLAAEAYVAAHNHGYRVVGGTCPTVGISGGYTQGGGHSILSSLYGLSADNVLEWEVVTADGRQLTVTSRRHKELFWALNGGGGGTFAVVLGVTLKLHPDGPVGGAGLAFNDSQVGNNVFWDAVGAWHKALPPIVDDGSVVTYMILNGAFTVYSATSPGRTPAQVSTLFAPFLAELASRNISYTFTPKSAPTFLDHFERDFGPLPLGPFPVSQLTGSRLLPRTAVTNPAKNAAITQALRTTTASGHFYLGCNALNVGSSPQHATYPDNAVLPAWRNAISHCIVVGPWDWTVPRSEMLSRQAELTNVITPALDAATPGSGTYLNEANFEQSDWRQQFYGLKYILLRGIKLLYDPEHLFYATTAVGSERWTVDGQGRLCKAI